MKNQEFCELLKRLSETFAPTGCEDRVIDLLKSELDGICEYTVDRMGDLICHLPGKGEKVALVSGVDEAGFMVSKIDDKGYVRVETTGNGDSACFLGKILEYIIPEVENHFAYKCFSFNNSVF